MEIYTVLFLWHESPNLRSLVAENRYGGGLAPRSATVAMKVCRNHIVRCMYEAGSPGRLMLR